MNEKNKTNDYLSWEKIKMKFPNQWVAVLEPKLSADEEFLGGKVFFADKNKNEVYKMAKNLGMIDIAFRYTGEIPYIAGLAKMELSDVQT